jgi:hypothetical protein
VVAFFENKPVGVLPFQPIGILRNFVTYKLDQDRAEELTLISAPFLFTLIFVSMKLVVRKVFFVNTIRMIPQGALDGVSLPSKVLFSFRNTKSLEDHLQHFLGMLVATWYSVYRVYKILKKYNYLKYTISITRNVSRLTGFVCSLYIPYPLRYVFYGGFAKMYGIDMSEVENPDFGHYDTFTLFFTRHLKKGVR